MTPIAGSSRAISNASRNSNNVRGRKALRTWGRQIVIFAMPSEVSYRASVKPSGVCGFQSAPGRIAGSMRAPKGLGARTIDAGGILGAITPTVRVSSVVAADETEVVAVVAAGPQLAEAARSCWDAGWAVLPINPAFTAA